MKKKCLLLVDDDYIQISNFKELLKKNHILCESCDSTCCAIEKLRKKDFCIVIIDCYMPIIDGFEAINIIKKFSNCQIFLSFDIQSLEENLDFIEKNKINFILKPFTEKNVKNFIEENMKL